MKTKKPAVYAGYAICSCLAKRPLTAKHSSHPYDLLTLG